MNSNFFLIIIGMRYFTVWYALQSTALTTVFVRRIDPVASYYAVMWFQASSQGPCYAN